MLHFSRWTTGLIAAICALAVLIVLPNFLSKAAVDQLRGYGIPVKTMSLGLDLQGGSHLLLEANEAELKQDWLATIEQDARARMRKAKLGYSGIGHTDTAVRVRLLKPGDADTSIAELKKMAQPIAGGGVFAANAGVDLVVTKEADGTGLLITPTEPAIQARITQGMSSVIETIRRRIDNLGTTEPNIQRQGVNRVIVQVPGYDDPEKLKELIGKTAKLSFHDVEQSKTPEEAEQTGLPPGTKIYPMKADERDGIPAGAKMLLKVAPVLNGEDLADAQATTDQQTSDWVVSFRLNNSGAIRFGKHTQENIGRPFAIVLDNEIISAPRIIGAILGGSGQITGRFSAAEANNLAILLRSGALPTSLTVVEQRSVGPTLGADTIHSGIVAAIIGSLLVIALMVLVYALFGIFANIAVVIHVAIIVALMTLLGSTLTLPGIAGLVLTVGMAVDANVLIYERIREEMRTGKTPVSAIEAGFTRAYATILDSQVTTLVAGVVMFWLGSGPVRGFAVTLSLGVLTTVFTSVTVTRLLVSWWLRRQATKNIHVPI